ncbi:sugar/pyridoxal phosphate phosphatase YigL, partial [Erwinia amylovora]|nr:sugar/pyridoxal phosphate phosphatase YigL [Erwinia amylovora]
MNNAHQRLKDVLPEREVIGSNGEQAVPHTLRRLFGV